jgi:hypothetical protein
MAVANILFNTVKPHGKSVYYQFLFLPEMKFMNIIFCSSPVLWGRRGCCLGSTACARSQKSLQHDGSRSLRCGSHHSPNEGAFFVDAIS